jgi:hypothetical protein
MTLSATRRLTRPIAGIDPPAPPAHPVPHVSEELTYRGYRIEPGSYSVNSVSWSPRVVVSLKTDAGGSPKIPLYATSTARFPTRDEADRHALDVARAWIDTTVGQQPG